MSVDRDRLRDTVNYLREVRPIDPGEIQEYFDDAPHPAVVRQELRAAAFDLDLVEQADGTFVPASGAPVDPPGWSPDSLPDRYERVVVDRLVERFGLDWADGDSGDELRAAIRRLKADYYHGNPVEYDETAALGYAIYHLPDYYAAMGYVLDDLAENRDLPRTLRVLDVGAGVGGPALALIDYLHDAADDEEPPLIEYHALEPSPAADLLEDLLAETPRNVHATVHRERAEAFDPASIGEVDLLSFCNVLSELADPVVTTERYLDSVADDGTMLALAPADLETATGLREVERALARPEAGPSVYSPTLRLWPDETPSDRGWSFDVRPDVEAPRMQRQLDEGERGTHGGDEGDDPGTFLKTSVQFAYALLRPDGKRRVDVQASPERHAKAAEMERHVSNRIDLLTVKLSPDLSRQGERQREYGSDPNPVFKIGDGTEQVEQYAVLTQYTELNRALGEAPYGAVLSMENALALWNDDEEAYNLVVDGETVVDLVVP
ncbi:MULTISPECIES: small ribosomal subunit Rsm22 family protein [Halolamina]|uniref:Small ribosomal subunit Rsm22 n=1 Tax=Halolamina pelagica TaxID=699431 RepID=A0A1I5QQ71_9EURY|nr:MULTISPECIES: small ribosomal subunit Rsm22 family protein [Halolamina]NHX35490.1 SAM-dependent methyltransferase [Halolamina sp. R1-12]SFP48419.1 small ribosomal subunit Rsm22 [Halolamina pelagica]